MSNIKPRDPVLLGLCSQVELNKILDKMKIDTVEVEELEKNI